MLTQQKSIAPLGGGGPQSKAYRASLLVGSGVSQATLTTNGTLKCSLVPRCFAISASSFQNLQIPIRHFQAVQHELEL